MNVWKLTDNDYDMDVENEDVFASRELAQQGAGEHAETGLDRREDQLKKEGGRPRVLGGAGNAGAAADLLVRGRRVPGPGRRSRVP